MIGVASRKAKRAASSFERPTSRPPAIVAPEREKPGISAIACAAPTKNATTPGNGASDARVVVHLGDGCAPAQQLGAVEQHAVERQEDRSRGGRGEDLAQRVLQRQAENAGGDRADDQQPAELGVGVVVGRSRGREAIARGP